MLRPRSADRRGRPRGSSATRTRPPGWRRLLCRASAGDASSLRLGAEAEADPVITGLDADESDLAEVERDRPVLGRQVIPTALLEPRAQVLEVADGEPRGDHL